MKLAIGDEFLPVAGIEMNIEVPIISQVFSITMSTRIGIYFSQNIWENTFIHQNKVDLLKLDKKIFIMNLFLCCLA